MRAPGRTRGQGRGGTQRPVKACARDLPASAQGVWRSPGGMAGAAVTRRAADPPLCPRHLQKALSAWLAVGALPLPCSPAQSLPGRAGSDPGKLSKVGGPQYPALFPAGKATNPAGPCPDPVLGNGGRFQAVPASESPAGQLLLPECPQALPRWRQGASMGLKCFLLPQLLPTPLRSSKPPALL